MTIENCALVDLNEILALYEVARSVQKEKGAAVWPDFSSEMIEKEISEKRHWKILIDGKIAVVWCITFVDQQIWVEENDDPSIYIHRIATDQNFRGRNLVSEIVAWAKRYALGVNKEFIRMDTVGQNEGLIAYYQKCGFKFLGLRHLKETHNLPAHYHKATVSLFEIKIS